jgi:uncharacterized protein with PQ loop repeat
VDVAAVVGSIAFVLSAAQLAQMGRAVLGTERPTGVSTPMWLLLICQAIAWVVFGVTKHLWPTLGINALLLGVAVAVLRRLLRHSPRHAAAVAVGVTGFAVAGTTAAVLGQSGVIGWIAGACTLVALVPQASMLLRTRDTAGLSLVSWGLGTAALVCWLGYGVALGTPQLIVSAIPPLVCSLVIVGALLRSRVAALGTVGR